MKTSAARVRTIYSIVLAVRKHVIAQDTLTSGCIGVRVDESTHLRIVITGLEIVERGLTVVYVTAISQRVHCERFRCNTDQRGIV